MSIKIGKSLISNKNPVFIIAELSCNHLQNFDIAIKTIREMKKAGANAVKIQTYTPDTLTLNCDNKYFKLKGGTLWDGMSLHQLYKEAFTPWEWHEKLQKETLDLGMEFFSTPQDESAVDFLKKMRVSAYKIASFEITHLPLIKYAAKLGKPMLISTGMAEFNDIKAAIDACKSVGNDQIILLKCTSAYPTPLEEVNLLTIPDIKKKFKTIVGLSDHTSGFIAPAAAVALGAKVIEKHFILDRKLGGPDAKFSMEPNEFKQMVDIVRDTEKVRGTINYNLSKKSKANKVFMRSIFVSQAIKKGDILTKDNVKIVRPSYGLEPKYFESILGKKAKKDLDMGTPLKKDLIT